MRMYSQGNTGVASIIQQKKTSQSRSNKKKTTGGRVETIGIA